MLINTTIFLCYIINSNIAIHIFVISEIVDQNTFWFCFCRNYTELAEGLGKQF